MTLITIGAIVVLTGIGFWVFDSECKYAERPLWQRVLLVPSALLTMIAVIFVVAILALIWWVFDNESNETNKKGCKL